MAVESPEYKTLIHHATDLRLTLQDNLNGLSIDFMSKNIITPYQSDKLRNRLFPEADRAADLLSWILRKLQEDVGVYSTFTDILKKEGPYYNVILRRLEETLKDYRGQQGNIIIVFG